MSVTGARLFPNSADPVAEFEEMLYTPACREKLRGLANGEKNTQIKQLKRAAELAGSAGQSTLSDDFAAAVARGEQTDTDDPDGHSTENHQEPDRSTSDIDVEL